MTITKEQLATISDKCISLNKWDIFNNCSYFAATVWNSIAPKDKKVFSKLTKYNLPQVLKISISSIDGHQVNRDFAYNDYTGYCKDKTSFKPVDYKRIQFANSSSSSGIDYPIETYSSFPEEYNNIEALDNLYETSGNEYYD